ncbi:CoA-binding protein [Aquicoccus sp. G2-2]|uniref:CoA-binding protein n=1 Tax=Aquicoccus sp. G2-2 TaxID=3092120 RepID=UPI002ADF9A04|nr:CoA-binding protein [Aquicoccus sp. G2-2]MEA1112621.1 CoA-binding protein [Aquicoccus sp. G2-2]
MSEDYTDEHVRDVLTRTKVIAVVGVSANPARPSHYVSEFLVEKGYRVIPVNPGLAGQEMFGETVRGALSEIDEPVDMVDIFRRPDAVESVVDEALAAFPDLQTVWMQLGVINQAAAQKARARGVDVIMDRCPKIEIPRLF